MADFDASLTQRLYTLLRNEYAGASEIELNIKGDQFDKGLSRLPMLTIKQVKTEVMPRSTGMDLFTETVRFTVTVSKIDQLGDAAQDENPTQRRLEHIVQGMLDDKHLHPESLLSVLRRNLTVESYGLNSLGGVEYPTDTENPEMTTAEAYIDWNFMRRVSQQRDS